MRVRKFVAGGAVVALALATIVLGGCGAKGGSTGTSGEKVIKIGTVLR